MILIGSRAAKHHFPDFRDCGKSDWDVVASPEDITRWAEANEKHISSGGLKGSEKLFVSCADGAKLEIGFARPGTGADLFIRANRDGPKQAVAGMELTVATPATLMLLKRSHLHFPIRWEKSIADYHFLKRRTPRPTPEEWAAYEVRARETEAWHRQRRVTLDKPNEEFFAQSQAKLKRRYEHDDLHLATCYYDRPLYESLKDDLSKAMVLKHKFERLPHVDKVRLVREECFAIALERVVIPAMEAGREWDATVAFAYALKRVSTTLTRGWFREFAIENHPEISENDHDYVGIFMQRTARHG